MKFETRSSKFEANPKFEFRNANACQGEHCRYTRLTRGEWRLFRNSSFEFRVLSLFEFRYSDFELNWPLFSDDLQWPAIHQFRAQPQQ